MRFWCRSLDELPPQTRRAHAVDEMVTAECERQRWNGLTTASSRREWRAYTCAGADTQLKIHLHRLEELEYLLSIARPRPGIVSS